MDFLVIFKQMQLESLEYPYALLMLLLLPVYGVIAYNRVTLVCRRILLPTIGHHELHSAKRVKFNPKLGALYMRMLVRSVRFWMAIVSLMCIAVCYICMTIAIAHPHGGVVSETRTEGIDIYFVLDMSASMHAYDANLDDVQANNRLNLGLKNRFETAQSTLLAFIDSRAKRCREHTNSIARCDRIGISLFAEKAFIDVPMTIDYDVLQEHITKRRINDIRATQSAIGDGLMSAISSLRQSSAKSKNIILISDGDSNGGRISISQALAAAREYHVRIFPIIIGERETAVIETNDAWGNPYFYEAHFPVNEKLLESIAEYSNGIAYQASTEQDFLTRLEAILDRLDTDISNDRHFDERLDLSPHLVLLSFLFALFGTFLYTLFVKEYP